MTQSARPGPDPHPTNDAEPKVTHAPNSRALMLESLQHHAEVVEAIRAGHGHAAARIARQNMYDYYAGYVPAAERETLRALIDE